MSGVAVVILHVWRAVGTRTVLNHIKVGLNHVSNVSVCQSTTLRLESVQVDRVSRRRRVAVAWPWGLGLWSQDPGDWDRLGAWSWTLLSGSVLETPLAPLAGAAAPMTRCADSPASSD